ncbi:voltage-dependent anion channel [Dipodascopsis uninucleata]
MNITLFSGKRLWDLLKYFSPAWFASVMGIGISGSILINYPFEASWLKGVGTAYWGVATSLMLIFSILCLLEHIIYRGTLIRVLKNPLQGPLYGCMAMGLGSVTISITSIFGGSAVWISYVLWWIDLILSLYSSWVIVFAGFIYHSRKTPDKLNAIILLPIVTLIVNSTTGASLVKDLPVTWQPHVIIICLLEWGNGELLAFAAICVYLWRLHTGNLPNKEAMITCFLPIGPLGQGAYGIMLNSQNIQNYLAQINNTNTANYEYFHYIGIGIALVMVGFASFWIFCAVVGCVLFPPQKFGLGWWALTFPLGTYAMATMELGHLLNTKSFKVISSIVGTVVVLIALVLFFASFYFTFINDSILDAMKSESELGCKKPNGKGATQDLYALV